MLLTTERRHHKVEIPYFEGCPNHHPTVERVREVAEALDVEADITEHDVSGVADPASLGFRGSPTVLVDGKDLEAETTEPTSNLGCRAFSGGAGIPERAVVERALQAADR